GPSSARRAPFGASCPIQGIRRALARSMRSEREAGSFSDAELAFAEPQNSPRSTVEERADGKTCKQSTEGEAELVSERPFSLGVARPKANAQVDDGQRNEEECEGVDESRGGKVVFPSHPLLLLAHEHNGRQPGAHQGGERHCSQPESQSFLVH